MVFIGGPCDGERRLVRDSWPDYKVPVLTLTQRSPVFVHEGGQPEALDIETFRYVRCVLTASTHVMVPADFDIPQILHELVSGYDRAKP